MDYWNNQTILITGSSRGIGRELAIHFSALGAKVAINYRASEDKAKEVLELCDKSKTKIYKADVGDEEEVNSMIAEIEKDLGAITVLINNAGQTKDGLLMMMPSENWHALKRTHLDGAFYCTRAVLMNMVSEKFGRVINISSISGINGTAGQCNYSTVKAGLFGFTKALAREMGKFNITSNAIALGAIETEMTASLSPALTKKYTKATSLKRLGDVKEVSGLVEYLASEQGSYMTGQVVVLDGGMS